MGFVEGGGLGVQWGVIYANMLSWSESLLSACLFEIIDQTKGGPHDQYLTPVAPHSLQRRCCRHKTLVHSLGRALRRQPGASCLHEPLLSLLCNAVAQTLCPALCVRRGRSIQASLVRIDTSQKLPPIPVSNARPASGASHTFQAQPANWRVRLGGAQINPGLKCIHILPISNMRVTQSFICVHLRRAGRRYCRRTRPKFWPTLWLKSLGGQLMGPTALLLGGTGRTGRLVLQQLMSRGANVRAIVRSSGRLPDGVSAGQGFAVVEADVLSLSDADLQSSVRGCSAVVSCLGHNITLMGIFGPPRDLVTRVTTRVCAAIRALRPTQPIKFILMSSVSVARPDGRDARRGALESAAVAILRWLIPPANDNQSAADFLCDHIGTADPYVEWVAVRPDSLLSGPVTPYTAHDGLVSSLARPDSTNMANVAHFMCDLALTSRVWAQWRGRLPVIINEAATTT